MTNEEAIDTIKTAIVQVEWNYPMDYAAAFDKAIEALKNGIPMKPGIGGDQNTKGGTWWYVCPACNRAIEKGDRHCIWCGKGLKWNAIN